MPLLDFGTYLLRDGAEQGFEKTKLACESSLKKLGLNYIDLYLIHLPQGDLNLSWTQPPVKLQFHPSQA